MSNFAQGQEYLRNIGKSVVDDPELDSASRISVGGLPAERFSGTGRRNGRAVAFTAVLIDLPGGRMAISLAVIEGGADPGLVDDVNAIYSSFRALR